MANTHILLITSNTEIIHSLADNVFRQDEFRVTPVNDILIADKYIQSYTPDLVILDASVEDEAGLDIGKKIFSLLPIVPVILLSNDNRKNALEFSKFIYSEGVEWYEDRV